MSSYTDEELFAVLSEISYNLDEKEKNELLHNHYGLIDYSIDEELSSENSTIILTPKGETIISFRGTDIHNPSDLVADAEIATGLSHFSGKFKPARFREAEETYQQVKEKYPDNEIITTGHSLGGHQSLMIAKNHGLEGHHFNVGASVLDAGIQLKNMIKCSGDGGGDDSCAVLKKQNIYTTGSDILSISMLPRLTKMFGNENINFVKPKKNVDFFHHSLVHFLPQPKAIAATTKKEEKQIYETIRNQDAVKFSILKNIDSDNFCNVYSDQFPLCEKKQYRKIKYNYK